MCLYGHCECATRILIGQMRGVFCYCRPFLTAKVKEPCAREATLNL